MKKDYTIEIKNIENFHYLFLLVFLKSYFPNLLFIFTNLQNSFTKASRKNLTWIIIVIHAMRGLFISLVTLISSILATSAELFE